MKRNNKLSYQFMSGTKPNLKTTLYIKRFGILKESEKSRRLHQLTFKLG